MKREEQWNSAKIRNLSDDELKSEQAKAGEQLFRIRFQKSLGNTEGIKKLRTASSWTSPASRLLLVSAR